MGGAGMRIHTRCGDMPFRTFTFPDGQRHVALQPFDDGGFREATIEAALTSMDAIFDVLLAKDVLDLQGFATGLDIRYLLGARMDRRINSYTPNTLEVVARLINGAGFRKVRILDPHSRVSCDLLDAETVYPTGIVGLVLRHCMPSETVIVVPDKGARGRVTDLLAALGVEGQRFTVVQCEKRRDSGTGALSGFTVEDGSRVHGKACVILDDICDGGGTFTGLAGVLREHGATRVDLYVTHSIMSKGLILAGVDRIFTTDSYRAADGTEPVNFAVFPISMNGD